MQFAQAKADKAQQTEMIAAVDAELQANSNSSETAKASGMSGYTAARQLQPLLLDDKGQLPEIFEWSEIVSEYEEEGVSEE
jgi:hypothetical protein